MITLQRLALVPVTFFMVASVCARQTVKVTLNYSHEWLVSRAANEEPTRICTLVQCLFNGPVSG